jgi:hypothetical protein
MSDGIMAFFGAPLAHEDHAVRACYAALQVQDSLKRHAEDTCARTVWGSRSHAAKFGCGSSDRDHYHFANRRAAEPGVTQSLTRSLSRRSLVGISMNDSCVAPSAGLTFALIRPTTPEWTAARAR